MRGGPAAPLPTPTHNRGGRGGHGAEEPGDRRQGGHEQTREEAAHQPRHAMDQDEGHGAQAAEGTQLLSFLHVNSKGPLVNRR